MNLAEALRSALTNLAAHKLRSSLTMLGMIFGVGAVIAMMSIGAGAERRALEMIERMGVRNVLVRARAGLKQEDLEELRKKSLGVSRRDARAIRDAVPGVLEAAPCVEVETYKVMSDGASTEVAKVLGVTYVQRRLSGLALDDGRFIDEHDERSHAQVAVVGRDVARELFGYESPIGRPLKINDVWFEVVGVLADSGEGDSFEGVSIGRTAEQVYVPVTTALRKFDRDPLEAPLDEIVVRLDRETSPGAAASTMRALLDRLHAGADDFELVVPEALLAQSRKTQQLFKRVMGGIAGISLLVGGIGIMNIMLATVLERTREIGVRRAVGARRADIRSQFIVESFTISLLGGLSGVAMGLLISTVVAAYAGWPTVVTGTSIVLSTLVSLTVGLASGIYPALRAAELDPIEALRHE